MSKIEVNTVDAQCGSTVTIGSAGKTVSVPGNIVKSNALQASDGGNIVNQCGTTVTLGATGDTIALASGATQTGFGRTGTVDWITTPKVTGDSPVTGVTGKGYFMNTTAGAITINLPAGAAGSIVSLADYAATWQTNNVTVSPNGAEKIGGTNASASLSTEGQSVTFVYVDSTQGWVNTMDSTSNVRGNAFMVATGGTPTQCGDYEIRTFTGPGTFCVSQVAVCAPNNRVDYLVVAGGGSGGSGAGGGGGAGGYRESNGTATGCYTVSPLGTTPTTVPAITVTASSYSIAVGGGGPSVTGAPGSGSIGNSGSVSSFSTVPSAGGGGGGGSTSAAVPNVSADGADGGSGGGGAWDVPGSGATAPGGTGNTTPVTPPQGMPGGTGRHLGPSYASTGGGGGALVKGTDQTPGVGGSPGGGGATSSINGTPTARAGGGGGQGPGSTGGTGGGGAGALTGTPGIGVAGTINTGGGGGGGAYCVASGGGGSGIVIIRYKFQ